MAETEQLIRNGRLDDAAALAELVNYAGEGLPLYLWSKLATAGQSAWDVGRLRAAREDGSFSYRNATIVEKDGAVAGCLVGYVIPDTPEPVPPDMPPMFVPLQELENLVPGTWYVNVLAVMPRFRGRGVGSRLLGVAEEQARALGKTGMSVIVSDANHGARRLYQRHGYEECAQRPMIKEDWVNDGESWVLMKKGF